MKRLPWFILVLVLAALGCGGKAAVKKKPPVKKAVAAKKTKTPAPAKTKIAKSGSPSAEEGTNFPLSPPVNEPPAEAAFTPPPPSNTQPAGVNTQPPAPAVASGALSDAILSYISDDFVGAIVIHPPRILKSGLVPPPLAQQLLGAWLDDSPFPLGRIGVTLDSIDEITVLIPDPAAEPQMPTFFIHLNRPIEGDSHLVLLQLALEDAQLPNGRFYGEDTATKMALLPAARRFLIIGPSAIIPKLVTVKPAKSPLVEKLRLTDVSGDITGVFVGSDKLRAQATSQPAEPSGAAGEFSAGAKALAEGGESAVLTVDFSAEPFLKLAIATRDEKYPLELEKSAKAISGLLKNDVRGSLGPLGIANANAEKSLDGVLENLLNSLKFQAKGKEFTATAALPANLKESVQSAFASAAKEDSVVRRMNDLKQYGVGLHTYHDIWSTWPISDVKKEYFDKDGKPFLSWRVHTLPQMEQQPLYDMFHLNEPWDSEHNLKLAEHMPPYLKRPGLELKTTLLMFKGPGSLQEGKAAPRDFKDGIDNTIFMVEAGEDKAVFWTKPDDLEFDPKNPVLALGALKDDFFLALIGDGRVVKLKKDIPADSFHALITRSGGEKVNWMDFEHK